MPTTAAVPGTPPHAGPSTSTATSAATVLVVAMTALLRAAPTNSADVAGVTRVGRRAVLCTMRSTLRRLGGAVNGRSQVFGRCFASRSRRVPTLRFADEQTARRHRLAHPLRAPGRRPAVVQPARPQGQPVRARGRRQGAAAGGGRRDRRLPGPDRPCSRGPPADGVHQAALLTRALPAQDHGVRRVPRGRRDPQAQRQLVHPPAGPRLVDAAPGGDLRAHRDGTARSTPRSCCPPSTRAARSQNRARTPPPPTRRRDGAARLDRTTPEREALVSSLHERPTLFGSAVRLFLSTPAQLAARPDRFGSGWRGKPSRT